MLLRSLFCEACTFQENWNKDIPILSAAKLYGRQSSDAVFIVRLLHQNLVACALGNDTMLNVLLYYVLTAHPWLGLIASDIWVFSLYDLVNSSAPLIMLNVPYLGL